MSKDIADVLLKNNEVYKFAQDNNLFEYYSDKHVFNSTNFFALKVNIFSKLNAIKTIVGDDVIRYIIQDKLAAGRQNFDINILNENVSEIEIMSYFLMLDNISNFKYEPKFNGKKNPEFVCDIYDKTFEVEVKCANFSDINYNSGDVILNCRDDVPVEVYKSSGLTVCYPEDNKIKDYLISAQSKFSKDIVNKNSEHYGLLFINWGDAMRFKYAYSILTNPNSGLFTTNSYYKNDSNFNRINAVIFYMRPPHTDQLVDYRMFCKYYVKNPFAKDINNELLCNLLLAKDYKDVMD